jgi:hypothetical protein
MEVAAFGMPYAPISSHQNTSEIVGVFVARCGYPPAAFQ